jgi:hypothetical protein
MLDKNKIKIENNRRLISYILKNTNEKEKEFLLRNALRHLCDNQNDYFNRLIATVLQ